MLDFGTIRGKDRPRVHGGGTLILSHAWDSGLFLIGKGRLFRLRHRFQVSFTWILILVPVTAGVDRGQQWWGAEKKPLYAVRERHVAWLNLQVPS